ncbi:MAG: DUF362 domain-containing protein [Acidobacteriota bacterium]|nr:MAG: DUF362 domain-containing protein [Acidobacteriota bacterium]
MSKKDKPVQRPDYVKAPLSRRQFGTRIAAVLGIGGGAAYLAGAPAGWPLSMKDPTGLRSMPVHTPVQLGDYRVAKAAGVPDVVVARGGVDAETRLRMALEPLGGITHFVQPGEIVLVKPNVAFDRSPNLGATSQPELLSVLVRMLLVDARVQEVRIADNPIESPADCFAKSGIRRAVEQAGGRVYLPDSNAFKVLHTPGAKLIEQWPIFHRPLTNVDKVIGVAPVKDHNLCHASMGMKNWYGLLGGRRNQFHQDIHEIVSDLSLMMRPTLTILDGSQILMKNGPTGGDPSDVKPGDAIVCGVDPVALDAWAFEHLLERGQYYPRYLALAEQKGSGEVAWTGRVREVRA